MDKKVKAKGKQGTNANSDRVEFAKDLDTSKGTKKENK